MDDYALLLAGHSLTIDNQYWLYGVKIILLAVFHVCTHTHQDKCSFVGNDTHSFTSGMCLVLTNTSLQHAQSERA